MFSIFWLNYFLILFYFLLPSNVDCMWNFSKGEDSKTPLLSQQNYDEASSSSSSIQSNQQIPTKANNGKKILLVTDAFYIHYNFFLNLANVLCYNGKYDVYLIVVNFKGKDILNKPLEGVRFIEVPYTGDGEYSQGFTAKKLETNWTVEDKKDDHHALKLLGFYMYGIYKAIIENPKVEIYGIQQRIFDWLKLMGQQFALGIAEFSITAGAFPLFAEIGLNKYIAATPKIALLIHLHFLGQERYYLMPELMNPQVYYTFYKQNQEKYLMLARKRALEKNLLGNHKLIKVEEMPKMWDLLRKSKYYLINVHPLGQFPFPNIPKRIVNIGGIEVEIEGILNEIEEEKRLKEKEKNKWLTGFLKNKVKEHFFEDPVFEWIKKTDCFVLFYMGELVTFKGFSKEYFIRLIETFVKYDKCKFVVQLREGIHVLEILQKDPLIALRLDSNVHKNIYFYIKGINLQKFLAQKNLRGFITAGDQKCFNQALYVGVPLILIPFTFEQKFNAGIVKYMRLGITVNHTKFVQEFPLAVKKLIGENQVSSNPNTFTENANKIKGAIDQFPNGQIKTFLETVEKAIEDKDEEAQFPEMPTKFEEIGHVGRIKPFSVVLNEFINSKQK